MAEIQDRRTNVRVPTPEGSKPLHSYVNLYLTAFNPMMSKLRSRHAELCVLRVSPEVLRIPGTVVADKNASSDHVRFGAGVSGLAILDKDLVFAKYWTDADQIAYWRKKSAKCAEVLVPDVVESEQVFGIYVSTKENVESLRLACAKRSDIEVVVNPAMFFA